MTAPFKRIKCPIHQGVVVARVEMLPDKTKVAVFWTRTLLGPNQVLGGRAAEAQDETRLALNDERIARSKIPYVVTWCPKCRREYSLPMEWLLDVAKHSREELAPTAVLDS